RQVHILFIFVLFCCSFFLKEFSFDLKFKVILYNCLFFVLVFCVLCFYVSVKEKKIINPFTSYFGLGDFMPYLAITPLFNLKNYIIFFIFSMLWALIIHIPLTKYIKKVTTVPLAGYTSLLLQLILLCESFFLPKKLLLL